VTEHISDDSEQAETVNPHVRQLAQLIAPPDPHPSHKDWGTVESELGIELPEDYMELIDTYGGGRFDGYLWVLGRE
jgi:hypothetical protein